jgi:hypothetical protein
LLDGVSSATSQIRFRTKLVPFPLVGIISPWNFPLAMSLVDAVPALLAGCAVIIKPSEVACIQIFRNGLCLCSQLFSFCHSVYLYYASGKIYEVKGFGINHTQRASY